MNEADERESMAALEQRDEAKLRALLPPLLLKPAFFGRKFPWDKKKGPTRGPRRRPVQTVRASSAIGMERESRRDRCGREAKSGGNFDFSHLKLICGFG